ncbi:LOW QUALITY PROTEIN: uncharacterized protein LOC103966596 [Pyrus x bretschneideri]|uniref:LOW QUALITY PROTEIN: uncharacterized protein LOC103966596 n=1 Tax=Pyrus x bretschneideri TaxID=225117 RepID=UPI00202F723C|nr:LOW QUALITY PROTEIN: uncharacterized protein LOC103966596 [Pyrus x bretschneideri]
MEDTFNVRVGKIFGSLPVSSPSPSSSSGQQSCLSSLWSLTDEEIERREWNRDKGSPEPEPEAEPLPFYSKSNSRSKNDFSDDLEKDLLDLDDDVEDEDEGGEEQEASGSSSQPATKDKPDGYNEEEWEIKSSIGRDCTLDFEEEEDGYDKVAVGKETAGDRLYMRDVNDYGIDIDTQEEVPSSIKDFTRDPRANHLAAKLGSNKMLKQLKKLTPSGFLGTGSSSSIAVENSSEDAANLKSILKRKNDNQIDSSKTQKRVRFDSNCKSNEDEEEAIDVPVEAHSNENPPVPDYIRNPSRYTHYTFDSSGDVDEESNKQAYMEFLNLVRKSNSTEPQAEDVCVDLSKPVTFIPRKKSSDAIMIENDGESERPGGARRETAACKVMPLAIAAEDNEDVCAMEEDEPDTAMDGRSSIQRTGRQYRTKTSLGLDE